MTLICGMKLAHFLSSIVNRPYFWTLETFIAISETVNLSLDISAPQEKK